MTARPIALIALFLTTPTLVFAQNYQILPYEWNRTHGNDDHAFFALLFDLRAGGFSSCVASFTAPAFYPFVWGELYCSKLSIIEGFGQLPGTALAAKVPLIPQKNQYRTAIIVNQDPPNTPAFWQVDQSSGKVTFCALLFPRLSMACNILDEK